MDEKAHEKVKAEHLGRNAYLYVRQSTMRQVVENQESTKRQYALSQRAVALGWPPESIVVIDEDQGHSGAVGDRQGFEKLVSEVGMGRGGIVLSLEAARLARNNTQWHRLLEICAVTDTLILDEEAVYDPGYFNDRLLLGLKGTVSEAEWHMIRSRLLGGMLNKASRGELKIRLPIGFVYDDRDRIVLDPDRQIQESVRHLFATFRREGSVFRTVRAFKTEGLRFPSRMYQGPRKGEVIWLDLNLSRVSFILRNPRYAGAYVYGRRTQKRRDVQGRPLIKWLPEEKWHALIKDAHEGYISWEDYEENLKRLEANRRSGDGFNKTAPREGPALLQGLALCGICGKRMRVRYRVSGGRMHPQYQCKGLYETMAGGMCRHISGARVDQAVGDLLVEAMNPEALDVVLAVQKELENRLEETDRLRYRQVERARQEAEPARRRYMRVDPDNRLVADSLEAEWNMRLRELREAEKCYEKERKKDHEVLTDQMQDKIRSLTHDFAGLWNDPQVAQREKKRIARLLIEDVTLRREPKQYKVHVRFRAGTSRTLVLPRPKFPWETWTTDPEVVKRIDCLLDHHTNNQVASILNAERYQSGHGKNFDGYRIFRLRRAYGMKSRYERLREAGLLSREELAALQGVNRATISKWREKGRIKGHLADDQGQYLFENPGDVSLRLKKRKNQNKCR
jgi:DNA invertase Pin-like site-specific DNA recombinase